jgi:hypothetical protein
MIWLPFSGNVRIPGLLALIGLEVPLFIIGAKVGSRKAMFHRNWLL